MGCFVVAGFVLTVTSHGPSAIAELLVVIHLGMMNVTHVELGACAVVYHMEFSCVRVMFIEADLARLTIKLLCSIFF